MSITRSERKLIASSPLRVDYDVRGADGQAYPVTELFDGTTLTDRYIIFPRARDVGSVALVTNESLYMGD